MTDQPRIEPSSPSAQACAGLERVTFVLAGLIVVADQATKALVRAFIPASRVTRAVSSEDASPFRFLGAVPSRNALSVS